MGEKPAKLDIYFEEKYGELSALLEIEGSESISYSYEDENGRIGKMFIKRPINLDIETDKQYYDIATPYGYGGPVIEKLADNKDAKEKLLKAYEEDFKKYTEENNIVAEFLRFHPLLNNADNFVDIYNPIYLQNTIAVYCDKGRPFDVEFSSGVRNILRRNLREGMTYEIIHRPDDLEEFKEIYFETMDRLSAKKYYYFSDEYFDFLLKNLKDFLILVNIKTAENIVIGSAIFFIHSGKFIHEHLSGTKTDYMKQSPAYSLKYAICEWAYENGYSYVHSGGGTTTDPEDSLLKYKRKFTKGEPFKFYIAKKIYNKDIYDKLVEKTKTKDSGFFPQYRDPSINKTE